MWSSGTPCGVPGTPYLTAISAEPFFGPGLGFFRLRPRALSRPSTKPSSPSGRPVRSWLCKAVCWSAGSPAARKPRHFPKPAGIGGGDESNRKISWTRARSSTGGLHFLLFRLFRLLRLMQIELTYSASELFAPRADGWADEPASDSTDEQGDRHGRSRIVAQAADRG